MTAVKEQFMQLLPEMQKEVLSMPDSDVQQIINIYFQMKTKNEAMMSKIDISKRVGIAKGEFEVPDDFDMGSDEIYQMLMETAL